MWDTIVEVITEILAQSGFASFFIGDGWKNLIMIIIACVLLFLAIKKQYEPYLLIPIAAGMSLVNLYPGIMVGYDAEPGAFNGTPGFFDYLYFGVRYEIYHCLIFLG